MLVPDRVKEELELIQLILTDKLLKETEKLDIITEVIDRVLK